MSSNPRYLVLVTRRRFRFFRSVNVAGPYTYQKALAIALAARDHNPRTFEKAAVHIAVREVNGPGSLPGSLIVALQRET